MSGSSSLPPRVQAEVRQILNRAARRLLAERIDEAKDLYLKGVSWTGIEEATGLQRADIERLLLASERSHQAPEDTDRGGRRMTTREVADWFGVSPETILRRWRAGEIPGYRLESNVLRFNEAELKTWLQGRRQR